MSVASSSPPSAPYLRVALMALTLTQASASVASASQPRRRLLWGPGRLNGSSGAARSLEGQLQEARVV